MEQYKFPCKPVANSDSVVSGEQYRFTVLDDRVLRYEWAEDGVFEDRASTFAIFRKFPTPKFRVKYTANGLEIVTATYRLTYDLKRFASNGLVVTANTKTGFWGTEWRYGDSAADGNLGGTARTLDDVDGRCDMGLGVLSKTGHSIIDDSKSMLFDGEGFVTARRSGDRIDGYLFCYGRDYKGAMESFYAISGQQPLVPRWALGNWWSRYHAYDHAEYLGLMAAFKNDKIPLSVAVIDMDWHWVKESFVPHTGWTGYSWNRNLFPDPEAFTKALHDLRLKVTLNDHPHQGICSHEDIYKELAKVLGHDTKHDDPIEFDPTSPTFMHAFFNIVHRSVEKQGCDFWWIDWQQGTNSRIPGFDPLWLLNHFQMLDTKLAYPNTLPIVFSRYAGPGSQRYPVGFSGDTIATWDSLQFQPEFTATASNIGYGWWSHDIGGHMPGYRNDECVARWIQYGVFSPILRLHSTYSQWMSKEPWLYRPEYHQAMQQAMQFRHRLVPYIYSVNVTPAVRLPLVQPLYWKHPEIEAAYGVPNEYYFGPSMIVSPVVVPRDTVTNLAPVKTWIPPNRYVDMFTGTVYSGDRQVTMYRALQDVPVLLPEGSIVPLDEAKVPENGCQNPTALEVLIAVGHNGHFDLIETLSDDAQQAQAENADRSIPINFDQATGRLTCAGGGKAWTFRFLSYSSKPSNVRVAVNKKSCPDAKIESCEKSGVPELSVAIPTMAADDEISIELHANPQLAVIDHTERLRTMLNDFQIHFHDKDKIWAIIESSQCVATKITQLLNLGTEEAIYGPIVELLSADERADA